MITWCIGDKQTNEAGIIIIHITCLLGDGAICGIKSKGFERLLKIEIISFRQFFEPKSSPI